MFLKISFKVENLLKEVTLSKYIIYMFMKCLFHLHLFNNTNGKGTEQHLPQTAGHTITIVRNIVMKQKRDETFGHSVPFVSGRTEKADRKT